MDNQEAIRRIKEFGLYHAIGDLPNSAKTVEAFNMAIESLQKEIERREMVIRVSERHLGLVRCEDCKYQDECEEIVLFDINDDEVMGHRVHWCSYGRRE